MIVVKDGDGALRRQVWRAILVDRGHERQLLLLNHPLRITGEYSHRCASQVTSVPQEWPTAQRQSRVRLWGHPVRAHRATRLTDRWRTARLSFRGRAPTATVSRPTAAPAMVQSRAVGEGGLPWL